MKAVGISYGHNDKYNIGAVGFYYEDKINAEVGSIVLQKLTKDRLVKPYHLYKANVVSFTDSVSYRPQMANTLGLDIIIDIHHNAFSNSNAYGAETLAMSKEGIQLGECILKRHCSMNGYYNRGSKIDTRQLAFNKQSKMTSLIFEGFFITNKTDAARYNPNMEAEAIVLGLYDYLGLKRQEITDNAKVYIVKAGDTLWAISKRLGVSVDHLVEKNKIANRNIINVGQKLHY